MRQIGTSNRTNRSRLQTKENTPFLCDLILLAGPTVNVVPRQGKKLALSELGHVFNACQFFKAMNGVQAVVFQPTWLIMVCTSASDIAREIAHPLFNPWSVILRLQKTSGNC